MSLISTLDEAFSLYIRYRDNWTCRRCHKYKGFKSDTYDCAHMVGRVKMATRWNPINAMGLDRDCHIYLDTHPREKEAFYNQEMHNDDAWMVLVRISNSIKIWWPWEIKTEIQMFRDKISAFEDGGLDDFLPFSWDEYNQRITED